MSEAREVDGLIQSAISACIDDGEYDPAEDLIRDPLARLCCEALGEAAAEIERLRALKLPPPDHVLLPDGRCVPYMGEFPVTKDGVIALASANVYMGPHKFTITKHITTPGCPVLVQRGDTFHVKRYEPVPIEECYSTPEAAMAAVAATAAAEDAAKKEPTQ